MNANRRGASTLCAAAALYACLPAARAQQTRRSADTKAATGTTAAVEIPKSAVLPCTVPFQTWNGLIIVEATLGKAGLQRFALDPGLDVCTVTPRAAQLVGTTTGTDQTRVTVYDQAHTAPQTQIPQLQFNSMKLDRVPVGMIDVLALLSPASARRMDAPVGWLGASLLSAFQVTLAYDDRYLLLDRPETPLPRTKGAITIPIEIQDGRVMLKLSVPGSRPFSALFSTAVPITIIPTAVAQQAKLKPLEMVSITQPGSKAGKVGRVIVPKLNVGRATLEGVTAVYVAPDAPPELSRTLAIIGADLLKRYRVTISYAHHLMILTPPKPPEAEKKEGDDADEPQKPKKTGRH